MDKDDFLVPVPVEQKQPPALQLVEAFYRNLSYEQLQVEKSRYRVLERALAEVSQETGSPVNDPKRWQVMADLHGSMVQCANQIFALIRRSENL